MGGGASSAAAEQMEEMMAYSVLLSKTITCMSFPGTYKIDDAAWCTSSAATARLQMECARAALHFLAFERMCVVGALFVCFGATSIVH